MKTRTIEVYSYNELTNEAKGRARDYVRNNWHDLAQHHVDNMMESLKALEKAVNGKLDYSISAVPDRGEYIKMTDYSFKNLVDLVLKKDDCPLTGMCYDVDVIEGLNVGSLEYYALKALHADGEYTYSDEGLEGMIEANEYEFNKEGEMI